MTTNFLGLYPNIQLCLRPIAPRSGERRRDAEQRTLRELLRERFGTDEGYSHYPSGAPYLTQHPELHISLSHSDAWLLWGESDYPLGVDIEDIGQQVERVRHKFCRKTELGLLGTAPSPSLGLHGLWSAKEAAYKLANPHSASLMAFELVRYREEAAQSATLELLELDRQRLISIYLYYAELYVVAVATQG